MTNSEQSGVDREEAIEWLERVGGERGEEYWQEAEHQEGQAYWDDLIESFEDLKEDFAIFVMTVDECPECGHDRGYFDEDDKLRCMKCEEVQPTVGDFS